MVHSKMEAIHPSITIDNEQVQQVQQFTHLENRISKDDRSKINIHT